MPERETRRALLDALADGPVAGPALADRLGVSRAAVWKQVEALRDAGFEVESGDGGYRVTAVPEYGAAAVEYGLDAPFAVEYHDELDSTNRRARDLAADGAADVVVLAERQTGGRGRLERAWASPPGGVWMSLLLRPTLPPARVPLLTLAAAVAVTRAAREAGVDARIKWPNDVIVPASGEERDGAGAGSDYRKLAGILTEMQGEADRVAWVVLGIGVNANVDPADLPAGATSLRAAAGDVERRRFVQRVLEVFDDLRVDPESILREWRAHADTLGRAVRVETPDGEVVGEAADVTDAGALVVETDGGRVTVHAGDCEHLRPV
jgi:BirA family biotin operon repressor/biotin-[acetyl-CoA-carboxylase] ligase